MSADDDELYEMLLQVHKYVAQGVAAKNPFYSEVACLGSVQRKIIGHIEEFKKICPDATEFIEWLDKFAKPALLKAGVGEWEPDMLTDLVLKAYTKTRSIDLTKEDEETKEEEKSE